MQSLRNRTQTLPPFFDAAVIIGLTVILTLVVVFATRSTVEDAPEFDYSKVGVHLLLDDGRNNWDPELWESHLSYAARIVGSRGFVVQIIREDDLDVARWQNFMDLADAHGLTPIIRLATTWDEENGYWSAPDDDFEASAAQWADFLSALDWHSDQKYIAVLNEPNNGHEWGGTPDATAYAQLFAAYADAFHAQIDGAIVMNAALDLYAPDTNGEPLDEEAGISFVSAPRFMEEMIAAVPDIFVKVDVWNSHSYPVGFNEPPRIQSLHFDAVNGAEAIEFEDIPELTYNRGINGYEWELWMLDHLGVTSLPRVIITETGWRHSAASPSALDAGDDYPNPYQAARYFEQLLTGHPSGNYDPILADNRVIGVIFFALDGVPSEWGHSNLLIMGADGTVIGTLPTFDLLERLQEEHGGEVVDITVEATAEVTVEATAEATAESTAEPTLEVTAEMTMEVTAEVTVEVTTEATAEATSESE
ncbi:MAG: hypothetical protein RLP44_27745 [Aggregatilineales bacterium]